MTTSMDSPSALGDKVDYSSENSGSSPSPTPSIAHDDNGVVKTAAPLHSTSPSRRFVGYTLRTLLLDLPLVLLFTIYASLLWMRHVQNTYMIPQLQAAVFTDERSEDENTYYKRLCDASDMTTRSGADLFLPYNATADDAYHHQLQHGFTIFQGILQPETCTNLRDFVVRRNRQLDEEEVIYVIENDHRYSFGLGTEEPSVTAAMQELASSPRLRPALEKVLGPDPALIEMTAITAEYGAVSQWWHEDVIPTASAIQWGRTFGPSYSIFVMLQNTTKAMGATQACPGTHFCSQGAMENFCDEQGFQLVGADGNWGQGDALLMNMNSWHRGFAHTDPDGEDRVMLILTFVPKPIPRAESRLLSMGITFSLRWDMWGHTLNDLAHADSAMAQPWATLRALGLYKKPSSSWGVDYITSASMRNANNDNGFRQDELETWMDRGGFKYLPDWLEHFNINWEDGESWAEYMVGTQRLCESFAKKLSLVGIGLYLILFAGRSVQRRGFSPFGGAVVRVLLSVSLAFLVFYTAKTRVDSTGWASDIKAGRRYASIVETERVFAKPMAGLSTLPTRRDVLIETRYGGEQLAMYNDYVSIGHPGNRRFRELIEKAAPYYSTYGDVFKDATATLIEEIVSLESGRFLYQGPDGLWLWLNTDNALSHIKRELAIHATTLVKSLMQTVRFVKSDFQYGVLRDTALARKHAVPYMEGFERQLLTEKKRKHVLPTANAKAARVHFRRTISLNAPKSNARRVERNWTLHVDPIVEQPYEDAWLAEGDIVEGYEDKLWYYGTIQFVNARGDFQLIYPDETVEILDQYSVRAFKEYQIGEQLQCWVEQDDDFQWCTLANILEDGSYRAITNNGYEVFQKLGDFRRPGVQTRTKHIFVDNYH